MRTKSTKVSKTEAHFNDPDWYATPKGRVHTQREFENALKNGTLVRSEGTEIPRTDPRLLEQLMEQAKQSATRPISIRLPIADIELAKRIASATGVGYQTVLKQAIRKGLKKAG